MKDLSPQLNGDLYENPPRQDSVDIDAIKLKIIQAREHMSQVHTDTLYNNIHAEKIDRAYLKQKEMAFREVATQVAYAAAKAFQARENAAKAFAEYVEVLNALKAEITIIDEDRLVYFSTNPELSPNRIAPKPVVTHEFERFEIEAERVKQLETVNRR